MIEIFGCILLSMIGIGAVIMFIDELRTNHKIRKSYKEENK